MAEFIKEWWGLAVAIFGFIAWIIRMEGRMMANSREIERLWEQRKLDMDAAKSDRAEVKEMLKEMRDDIRSLAAEIRKGNAQ